MKTSSCSGARQSGWSSFAPHQNALSRGELRHFRRGWTMLEVLVAISVISLLLALAIPAVQSARESSRRSSCQSQLRQLGTALHGFETSHREFPGGFGPVHPTEGHGFGIAPQARLLPWLGTPGFEEYLEPETYPQIVPYAPDQWRSWMRTTIPVLLCPSDAGLPGTNLVMCTGGGQKSAGDYPYKGVFHTGEGTRPAQVLEGLSNTIAASERVQSDLETQTYSPYEDIWGSGISIGWIEEPDRMASFCASLTGQPPGFYPHTGWSWDNSAYGATLYNHVTAPNSNTPDCVSSTNPTPPGPGQPDPPDRYGHQGAVAARSRHAGGVNVLTLDGSARFVSNTIDLQVWRALATIAGKEIVSDW